MSTKNQPIRIFYVSTYRRWCFEWWKEVLTYPFQQLWYDIYTAYHRARYGWAPRDTWGFDDYLTGVMGGGISHLSEKVRGFPPTYPVRREPHHLDGCFRPIVHPEDEKEYEEFKQWKADLRRWSQALLDVDRDDYSEIHGLNYTAWNEDERLRKERRRAALDEMMPWFEHLWD